MYEIINGKRYDTKTATKLDDYWNGCAQNDFSWMEEALYKTKKGNYFLAGEGGPMSKYAEPVAGGGQSGGSHIEPITVKQAAEWCEYTDNYDVYETEFNSMIEDA